MYIYGITGMASHDTYLFAVSPPLVPSVPLNPDKANKDKLDTCACTCIIRISCYQICMLGVKGMLP